MYGMVNKAVEEMVISTHGETVWREIKRRAGVNEEVFISNEGYPDEITYRLVGAVSDVLQMPGERILHAFGEHWVLNTARKGYGHLLAAGGATIGEFLTNLPRFHDRIALHFPNLEPPRFEVSDRTPHSLHLHYHTRRPGLTPFVEGMLSGLGRMFATAITVTIIESRATGAAHDVFRVEW